MEKRRMILRTVFIGLAVLSGIFWLIWAADINSYTHYQILIGALDMTVLRWIFAGMTVLFICGFIGTLHFRRKKMCALTIGAVVVIYGVGLLISTVMAGERKYYTFQDEATGKALVVLEEHVDDRRQAVFYERKNPLVIEYLGNMGYYSGVSAFDSNNYEISWQDNGQVIIRVKAQFDGALENVRNSDGKPSVEETKEQIYYVSDK